MRRVKTFILFIPYINSCLRAYWADAHALNNTTQTEQKGNRNRGLRRPLSRAPAYVVRHRHRRRRTKEQQRITPEPRRRGGAVKISNRHCSKTPPPVSLAQNSILGVKKNRFRPWTCVEWRFYPSTVGFPPTPKRRKPPKKGEKSAFYVRVRGILAQRHGGTARGRGRGQPTPRDTGTVSTQIFFLFSPYGCPC